MKLLLDENLSPTLAETLAETYALHHGYTIVTKDADFHHRSLLHGHPPKIIWIRLGSCSTHEIAELLIAREEQVKAFLKSTEHSFLVLA